VNIQGLPENDEDLRVLCQQVLELMNDAERLWQAMPQAPQMEGDCPQDPNWVPPESS
jgi:hypothetical protein